MTFKANLADTQDISFAVTYLSMSVAERLRKHSLCCNTVAITLRTPDQSSINRQLPLNHPSCLCDEISKAALELIRKNHKGGEIYSLTVHAEKLSPNGQCVLQQQLFSDPWEEKYQKKYSLETAVDSIRSRFGRGSLCIASSINNRLI
jgi:hypothetical protein